MPRSRPRERVPIQRGDFVIYDDHSWEVAARTESVTGALTLTLTRTVPGERGGRGRTVRAYADERRCRLLARQARMFDDLEEGPGRPDSPFH